MRAVTILNPKLLSTWLPHLLQRLAEKFLHLAAAQADDVRVLLLQAGFVIMLVASKMHQVELVDQAALFQQFQRPIDRDAIQLGVLFLGQLVERFGVQMQAGAVDQVEQDAALAGQPDATFAERILNSGAAASLLEGSKFASHSRPQKGM